jgi:glutamate synthase domain-containing protein 1
VHNGIIENFRDLRDELAAAGMVQESQTDTETVAMLASLCMARGMTPVQAAFATLLDAVLRQQLADLAAGLRPGNLVDTGVMPQAARATLKDALKAVRSFAKSTQAELTGTVW